jgi:hypothetical protein
MNAAVLHRIYISADCAPLLLVEKAKNIPKNR